MTSDLKPPTHLEHVASGLQLGLVLLLRLGGGGDGVLHTDLRPGPGKVFVQLDLRREGKERALKSSQHLQLRSPEEAPIRARTRASQHRLHIKNGDKRRAAASHLYSSFIPTVT